MFKKSRARIQIKITIEVVNDPWRVTAGAGALRCGCKFVFALVKPRTIIYYIFKQKEWQCLYNFITLKLFVLQRLCMLIHLAFGLFYGRISRVLVNQTYCVHFIDVNGIRIFPGPLICF